MSGPECPALRSFDDIMARFMKKRSIRAGSLAVAKDGRSDAADCSEVVSSARQARAGAGLHLERPQPAPRAALYSLPHC